MKRLLLLIAAAATLCACQKEPDEPSSGLPLLSALHQTRVDGDSIMPRPAPLTGCGGVFEPACVHNNPPIHYPQPWSFGGNQ